MKPETREKIIEEMVQFAQKRLPLDIDVNELKRAFPFHAVFFTDEGLRAFKNQRSIVTSMGQSLIPRIAMLIAEDRYEDVHREYQITGMADEGMVAKIRQIVSELRTRQRKPDAQKEWNEILQSASGNMTNQQVVADLYIGDFAEGPLFLEIKSPRPNLDICAQSKQKLLIFRAIKHAQGQPQAQAYLGLWYNPDIYPNKYSHEFTRQIMDMEHEVLLGEELWNKIGGPGTYDELMGIIEEVKRRLHEKSESS